MSMNLKQLCISCADLLDEMLKKEPLKQIKIDGEKHNLKEAIDALDTLYHWAYPKFDIDNLQKVVFCKDCKHYKRYRKKGQIKPIYKCLCELDKMQKDNYFYCKNGEEKHEK